MEGHTASGIMIQGVTWTHQAVHSANMTTPKIGERFLHLDFSAQLPPFYITNRERAQIWISMIPSSIYLVKMKVPFKRQWRYISSGCNVAWQVVKVNKKRPVLHNQWAHYRIQSCQRPTKEVSQENILITFDFGVLLKARPIIWQNPTEYSRNNIILTGTFNAIMNYLNIPAVCWILLILCNAAVCNEDL